jgi:2'-5' RNA ligase
VKSGIVVIAELTGDVGARILEIQQRHDPRMAAELPPHITLVGSSGMGPLPMRTPLETLREKLEPITSTTPPIELRFGAPTRFMQTNIVVLPLDPHGPLRTLHERLKTSGLRAARPRFYFTPHVTLNLYRELPPELLISLLAERFDEPVTIDTLEAHLTRDTGESRELASWKLGR